MPYIEDIACAPRTTPTVEEIAGEIWRCVKEDFEKQGVILPPKWNGIGLAYSGYVRAGEIMRKALDARYEEGVKAERERVMEWAKMHDMPKNMSDDTLAGYNEALTRLVVSHITI